MIIVQPYNVIKLTERARQTDRETKRERDRDRETKREGVSVADSDDFSVWHAQSTIDF